MAFSIPQIVVKLVADAHEQCCIVRLVKSVDQSWVSTVIIQIPLSASCALFETWI